MPLRALVLIFVVALVVRLIHLWLIRDAPFVTVLMGDARGYDVWAREIAAGDWLGHDVFYQAPLYPYFLGTLYTLFGRDLLIVRIVQAILGSLSCGMLGVTAAMLFSNRARAGLPAFAPSASARPRRSSVSSVWSGGGRVGLYDRGSLIGLVAGLGLALYAPAIFFDGVIQKTTLDVFFMCLALLLLARLVRPWGPASEPVSKSGSTPNSQLATPNFRTWGPALAGPAGATYVWLALGLAMGALALTRENALVLVVVVVAWIVAGSRHREGLGVASWLDGRRLLTSAGPFVIGLAILLVPVAARNSIVGGGFYITTSQFGPNFYIGNNPRSDGTYMSLRPGRGAPEYERQDATDLAEHAVGHPLTPSGVSTYWSDRALAFITSHPADWLRLLGRKFMLLWNAGEMLDTESLETHAEWSTIVRIGSWFGHFGLLVPLAFLGVVATWHERKRLLIFYALGAAYAASVVAFYVFARYRFPLVPLLMLFASAGVASIPRLIRASSASRTATIGAFTLGIAVFTNWPMLSTTMMRAVTENNLAAALQEDGQLDMAIDHYRRAIALEPDYAPAYNNLGTALRARGRVSDAIDVYRRALDLMPAYPDAHYNLANALIDTDKLDESAEHFRVALQSIPGAAGAHNNLGIALAGQGKTDEAIAQFREALEAEPGSAKALRNLGSTLASRGQVDEGVDYLRRAIALAPRDADMRYDLGRVYLEAGRDREATDAFRRALELMPNDAATHNNLGIALAKQGQVSDAIEHFRSALRIQPGFADAARNLALAQQSVRR